MYTGNDKKDVIIILHFCYETYIISVIRFTIPYHYNRFDHFKYRYKYPISYKIAKKSKSLIKDLPY
jgi:hypothetical protein